MVTLEDGQRLGVQPLQMMPNNQHCGGRLGEMAGNTYYTTMNSSWLVAEQKLVTSMPSIVSHTMVKKIVVAS